MFDMQQKHDRCPKQSSWISQSPVKSAGAWSLCLTIVSVTVRIWRAEMNALNHSPLDTYLEGCGWTHNSPDWSAVFAKHLSSRINVTADERMDFRPPTDRTDVTDMIPAQTYLGSSSQTACWISLSSRVRPQSAFNIDSFCIARFASHHLTLLFSESQSTEDSWSYPWARVSQLWGPSLIWKKRA